MVWGLGCGGLGRIAEQRKERHPSTLNGVRGGAYLGCRVATSPQTTSMSPSSPSKPKGPKPLHFPSPAQSFHEGCGSLLGLSSL